MTRSTSPRGIFVADAPWPTVARRLEAGAVAVLPIGAAAKEHGPHLPLGTDWHQVEWLARELVMRRDVVVWPTLNYGFYPVFVDYPGSISTSQTTFIALVTEIALGLQQAGAIRVVILNTGISTIEPLETALGDPRLVREKQLINVYHGPRFIQTSAGLAEQTFGGHADEIETSLMLTIAPHLVDLPRAVPATTRIARGLFNRYAPHAPNFSASGVNGNPTLASATKGEQLLHAMLADVEAEFEITGAHP
ncbi:MAG: creatininase family protein [Gammaproteobacteria bacterium]|nr:creatininase family protein [Gammaproteobacteria bacterium]